MKRRYIFGISTAAVLTPELKPARASAIAQSKEEALDRLRDMIRWPALDPENTGKLFTYLWSEPA